MVCMGRVSRQVTEARRRKLRELLASKNYVQLAEVCAELGVSEATARRDLASLEDRKLLRRTHGGAISPYAGALGDFEAFFPTFDQRRLHAEPAKFALARALVGEPTAAGGGSGGVGGLKAGMTVFIDSGTTCYAVAERLERSGLKGLTVVTHNLAVAVKLSPVEGIEVHVVGGRLLPRQAGLFGDETCRAVAGRHIDLAIMGCEGLDARGTWNSQKDVVRVQRAVLAVADKRCFALDASKLGKRAPVQLCPWEEVDLLVTDATASQLRSAGIDLTADRVRHVKVGNEDISYANEVVSRRRKQS